MTNPSVSIDAEFHAPRVGVIIGSTRPTRICPGIARWSQAALQDQSALDYQLIDLAEVNLPLLDEPLPAARRDYKHEHTKAWSELIGGFDAFVFVFPQYNWGYPAALKNALDYLYFEWHDKPATSVTYGTRGGAKSADQIHQVFDGLHMRRLEGRVEVVITDDNVDANWQLTDLEATMGPYREQFQQIEAEIIEALEDDQAQSTAA
jgi:NAD(P)H-dependent FMN reductase